MAIISWKDCYATGIAQCDAEHQELVKRINALYEAIRSKETEQAVPETIEAIISYTIEHFDHEEELLKTQEYPDLEEHLKEHAELKEKVADFKQRLEAGEEQLHLKLFNFLREWLLHHIVETDIRYGEFLQSKGVS